MKMRGCPVLLAAMLWFGGPALADCSTKDPFFADEFQDKLGGWDPQDGPIIGNGMAIGVINKGKHVFYDLNDNFLVRDADICVTATFSRADKLPRRANGTPTGMTVGLIFAARDYNFLHVFMINTTGQFGLVRLAKTANDTKGPWTWLVDWTGSPAIRKGYGETNQLEVILKGNQATLIVNGQTVGTARLEIDSSAKKFGFRAEIDDPAPDGGVQTVFKNFVVNLVPP